MAEFIGIHYDQGGNIWLEKVKAGDEVDAIEEMERNDTNLIVMPRQTFDRLHTIEIPEGKMVRVTE